MMGKPREARAIGMWKWLLRDQPPGSIGSREHGRETKAFPGQIGWNYSVAELWADGAIHVLGAVISVVGAIVLLASIPYASGAETGAVAVYLATLIAAIVLSGLYNLWPVSRAKWLLRRFDHSAIYLLIAGTYTPFMIKIGMWKLLILVWAASAGGVGLKMLRPGRYDRVSIALYIALGWSGIAIYDRLASTLPATVLWLIAAGGLTYSLGVAFHVWERLRFQNAIWHGFVLAAATTHYAAVWLAMRDLA